MARRDRIRAFLESVEGRDLIIGSFSASENSETPRSEENHPKNQIENEVRAKFSESFPGFDYSRPRSEFFIISRDFFYEFNREVPAEDFCDDFTAQLLVYAHLRNKRIHEYPLGTYFVKPEEIPPEKAQKQLERIQDVINWGMTIELVTDAT